MKTQDLLDLSNKFKRYDEGKDLFDDLSKLSQAEVQACSENYKPKLHLQPVNLLRFLIAEQLKKGVVISGTLIDKMKKAIEARDISKFYALSPQIQNKLVNYKDSNKGMFPQWKKPFSILYPFFYQASLKQEVEGNLNKIAEDLIEQNALKDVKVHIVGFDGTQNYGSSRLWGAIIPLNAPNVQSAYQLFFSIYEGRFEAGLYRGHKVGNSNFENIQESYTDLSEVNKTIASLVNDWDQLNKSVDFGLSKDESDFKARISSNDSLSLTVYFNCIDKIIEKLNIYNSSNLVFSTGSNNLSFHVGTRYCLTLKNNKFSFITLEDYFIPGLKITNFSEPYKSNFYNETDAEIVLEHIDAIIEAVHFEIERNNQTIEKFDNVAFRKAVFDKNYRATFFENTTLNFEKPKNEMINHQPLNQILFGPPGTGKTYHTINKALEIIEGKTEAELNLEDRSKLKRRYDEYVASGQIVFTTFHQSMSYEDFIEGIKPSLNNSDIEEIEGESSTGAIDYVIDPGIFKRLCTKAEKPAVVDDVFDFDLKWAEYYNHLISQNGEVVLKSTDSELKFEKLESTENSIKVRFKKSYNPEFSEGTRLFPVGKNGIRKIFDARINLVDPKVKKWVEISEIIGKGRATVYYSVYRGFFDFCRLGELFSESNDIKPHVLIIDEINRGNVSQIFGELITLIEDDKRLGKSEELKIKLPYSKELFGVPSNLYIIGTMNTADRSVEALDTALRRRFVFEEMSPDFELLNPYNRLGKLWAEHWDEEPETNTVYWGKWNFLEDQVCKLPKFLIDREKYIALNNSLEPNEYDSWVIKKNYENVFKDIIKEELGGIRIDKILEKINLRIEKLLGKDYQIGHAFFINVYSLDELRDVFHQKILPLLQEYFYGDIGKIALVIGDAFMEKVNSGKVLFNSNIYHDQSVVSDLELKVNYKFTDKDSWSENSFIAIYS